MAVTDVADRAYRQLSPRIRSGLLARFGRLGDAPDELAGLDLTQEDLRRLKEGLAIIFSLADPSAKGFVINGLRDAGWTTEQFRASAGGLDRAAELFLADEEQARHAFKWWNANAIVRNSSRSDGYQLPADADAISLKDGDRERLRDLIKSELDAHRGAADIVEFTVEERPSPWPAAVGAGMALQIDIKLGNEPEQVEIALDGRAEFRSFSFVSTLVIVIDLARRSIHVGSGEGRRRLRSGLASTVFQHFWARALTLQTLPHLPVHTRKFSTRPDFGSRSDAVKRIAVSELWFHVAGQSDLKRAIIAENGADMYRAPEFDTPANLDIYRVRVTIWFPASRKGDPDRRRILTLLDPNTLSFPHFTLAEQVIAEKLLAANGYIDTAPSSGSIRSLELLDRLAAPDNSSRVRRALGATWFDALTAADMLQDGDRSDFAFCEQCLQPHLSEGPSAEQPGQETLRCEFGAVNVGPEAFATIGFSRRRFAAWLGERLGTDIPAPHERDEYLWDIGLFPRPGKAGRLRVVLAFALSSDSRFVALTQHASRSRGQDAAVLTFTGRVAGSDLQNGWKVLDLNELLTLQDGQISISADDVANAYDGKGRRPPNERRKLMDWPDLLAEFEKFDDGRRGHYEIAKDLVSGSPGRWPVDAHTIARKLKDKYPDRFKDQIGKGHSKPDRKIRSKQRKSDR